MCTLANFLWKPGMITKFKIVILLTALDKIYISLVCCGEKQNILFKKSITFFDFLASKKKEKRFLQTVSRLFTYF